MYQLLQDVRLTLRCARREPAVTAVALATLALGLGANTAIFSVVDAVLFRPLPYPDPSRLVMVWETRRNLDANSFENPDEVKATRHWLTTSSNFEQWEKRSQSFQQLAGFTPLSITVTGRGEPERLQAGAVTPGYFSLFHARTALGRSFQPDEADPSNDQVVVLGYGYWLRAFGGERNVLGQVLNVNGIPHTIIGVMERNFRAVLPDFPPEPDCYLTMTHAMQGTNIRFAVFWAAGRLAPGVSLMRAQAEMSAIAENLDKLHPRRRSDSGVELVPLHEEIVKDSRTAMMLLLGVVGCVLLVCCANLANLLLTRASARQREISTRIVLGASTWRLLRQFLTEGVLLAMAGEAAALAVAQFFLPLLVSAVPPDTLPPVGHIGLNFRVYAFGFALTTITGVAFGLVPVFPALRWSEVGLGAAIKEGGGVGAGRAGRQLRNMFVVAQMSLTLMLLTAAGLLARGFAELRSVELGFRPDHVLTAEIVLPDNKYSDATRRAAFIDQAQDLLQRLPGAEAVAITNSVPLAAGSVTSLGGIQVEGGTNDAGAGYRTATPEYFRIMGIPLKAGRLFTTADSKGQRVIVNETFVRRYWPSAAANLTNVTGRRLVLGNTTHEVIGVVGDIKFNSRKSGASAEIYVPHTQTLSNSVALVIRTAQTPAQMVPALRAAIRSIDATLPVARIATMDDLLQKELAPSQFHMLLLACFAILALSLSAVGMYGVVSYSVTRRTREFGIRMAIGASRGMVLRMVLREALLVTVAGLIIGLMAARLASGVLASLLYGVNAADPVAFSAAAGVLVAVGLLAAWFPARRVLADGTTAALRCE